MMCYGQTHGRKNDAGGSFVQTSPSWVQVKSIDGTVWMFNPKNVIAVEEDSNALFFDHDLGREGNTLVVDDESLNLIKSITGMPR